jgi:hypothetical protein
MKMKFPENIERSIKTLYLDNIEISADVGMDSRILGDSLAAMEDAKKAARATARPNIWRTIMKNRITKPAAAAAIIIAIMVVILHIGDLTNGAKLFAQALVNVENANSAIFKEKLTFRFEATGHPFLSSDAVCYYSSEHGERDDMYDEEGVLLHQMYWLPDENLRIRIIPPLKQYERSELTEVERAFWEKPSIRALVDLLKSEKYTQLGRKIINGREAEGFKIPSSEVAEISPITVVSGVALVWIDVETRLPVQYEAEVLTTDKYITLATDGKPVLIQITGYEQQWDVELEPNIFEPNIPLDYVNVESLKTVSTVHMLGKDKDEKQIELWSEINPDTGLMINFHLHQFDKKLITISTPEKTYYYDLNANAVKIKDGPGIYAPFRIGNFMEDMKKLAQNRNWRVEEDQTFDAGLNKDVIVLQMSSQQGDIKAIIDSDTKLPVRLDWSQGLHLGLPFELKDVEIFYEDQLPEGIFELDIPEKVTVIGDTIEASDEIISATIIQYAAKIYRESAEKAKETNAWCNTRITAVDAGMNVYGGGAFDVSNDSSNVWTGEVPFANTDSTKIAVFNEKGSRVKARLVQRKPLSPGRFREYITLDEPLDLGQKRSFVYWDGYGKPCPKTDTENTYTLTMQNCPGSKCLESFILVLAPNIYIQKSSREHTFYERINERPVYVWQEHIPPGENHKVTVELVKKKPD